MICTQDKRLADIRAQMEKWLVLEPMEAQAWDMVFLLKLLDQKNERIRELERVK